MGGKGSGRGRGRPLSPCGTVGAYLRHKKAGQDCQQCLEAMRVYNAGKPSRYKPRPPRTAPTPKDKKKLVLEAKFQRGACAHCQLVVTIENWIVFEWDHIDPTIKSFGLSDARRHTIEAIIQELDKCQLLCSNCHQLHTYTQQHFKGKTRSQPATEAENLFAYGLGNT